MVIYNAVHDNATEETTQAKELVSLPESLRGRVRLITVGRLVTWKGVDLIIKALSDLPQACLTVVGDGPCREEWEALATKEGVAGRLWFTGAVSRVPLRMLLRVHHIFVLASSYEGLPHIVLEAMHAGLPVVATAVGGTPEIVRDGENGLLVSSRDKGSLAKALRELVTSRDLRARLRREASVSLASFSFTHMLLETEQTLAGVAWKRADGS